MNLKKTLTKNMANSLKKAVWFLAIIALSSSSKALAKSPMPVQKIPDASHLVVMLKGQMAIPYQYDKNPLQWLGVMQASYGITDQFAVDIEVGLANRSYSAVGNNFADSVSAKLEHIELSFGGAIKLKPFKLDEHVNVAFIIGGHYAGYEPAFDIGVQIESRTGRLGFVIAATMSAQVMRIAPVFPWHISIGVDYSLVKEVAVFIQSDIGFSGARLSFASGIMISL